MDSKAKNIDTTSQQRSHTVFLPAVLLQCFLSTKAPLPYLLKATSVLLFVLPLLVGSCSQEKNTAISTPTPTPGLHTTPGPHPTPTLAPIAIPTLSPPLLGAAPNNCPSSPPPQALFSDIIPVVGTTPVWVAGFVGPPTTLHIGNGVNNDQSGIAQSYTQYGWERKILWRVSRNIPGTVTLRGSSLQGNDPLWFQIEAQAPTTTPLLTPVPSTGSDGAEPWTDFSSYIFIPKAGCYSLEAHWPGGSWRIFFASGL